VQRRRLFALAAPVALAGCGFELRRAPAFAFQTLQVGASSLTAELGRTISHDGAVRVVTDPKQADAVLDVLGDQREKVVVGLNTSGQVREFQLRARFKFRLRTPKGKELIPETELLQQRDISFTESAALAKEAEENLLYRNMQTDIVQQLIRRLAAVKSL
jgi:LPS-assembly lipoprotein